MAYRTDLRSRIIRYRSRTGISQVKFAEQCGVHPLTIMKVEKGGKVRPVTEVKILDFLEANNG